MEIPLLARGVAKKERKKNNKDIAAGRHTGFIYVPVWVFAEVDDKINEPVQLIMLDAQTGDVVEIK